MAEVPPLIIEILGNAGNLLSALELSEAAVAELNQTVRTSSGSMVTAIDGVVAEIGAYDAALMKAAASSTAGTEIILNDLGVIQVEAGRLAQLEERLAYEVAAKRVKAAVAANEAIVKSQQKTLETIYAEHNAELAAENDMLMQSVIRQAEERQAAANAEVAANERKLAEMLAQQEAYMRKYQATLEAEAAAYNDELALENRALQAHVNFAVRERGREAAAAEAAFAKQSAAAEAAYAKQNAAAERAAATAAGAPGLLASSGAAISSFGAAAAGAGRQLAFGLTLPLSLVGGYAIKMSVDYSDAMRKVAGLTNASADQVKIWQKEVLQLSSTYGISAQDSAEALYLIASNNLKGKDATDALVASMETAATGMGKVGDIARLVSSILNAYAGSGLTAKNATDVLTAAAREGHMQTETLANAFSRVLPIASAMHVNLGDVGAAFAVISREGMNANEAATAIRAMFSQLEKNSNQTAKGLKAVGLSAGEIRQEIAEKGLLPALRHLEEATGGSDAKLAKIFGNIRGLTGVLNILTQNNKSVAEAFDAVRNSVGSTDKAFSAASDTLGFKFNQAFIKLKNAMISIGDVLAPIIADVATFIGNLVDKFKNLDPAFQKIIVIGGLLAAALGPVLMVLGALIESVGIVAEAIAALASPVGIAIAAIAALGVILAEIWANSENFRKSIIDLWNTIRSAIASAIAQIQAKLKEHETELIQLKAIFKTVGDFLASSVVPVIKDMLVNAFKFLADTIGSVIDILGKLVSWFVPFYNEHLPLFTGALQGVANMINTNIIAWNALDKVIGGGKHQIAEMTVNLTKIDVAAMAASQAHDALSASIDRTTSAVNQLRASENQTTDTAAQQSAEDLKKLLALLGDGGGAGGAGGKAAKITQDVRDKFTKLTSDINKQKDETISLVKNLQKLGADAKEQFTALNAASERVDLPSVISKAFGEKGSVDSAISEFTKLNDGLKNASDEQRSILRTMVQTSINLMTQNASFKDKIQQAQDDLGKATAAINSKYDALDKAASAATASIKARYDALLPTLESALTAANKAFDDENKILDDLINARKQAMDGIKSGFESFMDDLSLDPRARTFTRSLELRLNEVKQFTANVKTLMSRGLDEGLIKQFVAAGPGSAGATVKQLATASAETLAHVNDMQAQLTAQITDFQSTVSAQWYDAGVAQQQAIVEPLKTAAMAAQQALDQAKAARDRDIANAEAYAAKLKEQRQQELDAAKAAFDAFSAEMGKKIDANNKALNENAQAIDKVIVDLAATLEQQATQAGIDAVNGLANGLKDSKALHNLVQRARDAAQAAIDAMKKTLGIASPSKVTMELGGHVADGLARGMAGRSGVVSSAAAGLARATIPRIPYVTAQPMGASYRQSAPSSVSNNSNITVNAMTNADAHQIAREVAWAVKVGV